jgi:L-2-hydroxyglutarate oxidase
MQDAPVAIVGGGIIGLAVAYRLVEQGMLPWVFEKEPALALHQSGRNSGVLHAGLYYKPGSAKARLAVRGIRQMVDFCRGHGLPVELCGKVVVATRREELPRLDSLLAQGQANGLRGLRRLGPEELREFEPHVRGVGALWVPEEGITDFRAVSLALAKEIEVRGGKILTGSSVIGLRKEPKGLRILTPRGDFPASFLVNCAGLYSDRICRMAEGYCPVQLLPFRGEYYRLREEASGLVRSLVYPVPDPRLPFLGVHFTRRIDGTIDAGPNAVLAFAREGYKKSDLSLPELGEILAYPGFWSLLLRYPRAGAEEFLRSISRKLFCRALQRLVPEITETDLVPHPAGVRAQAVSRKGELVFDFLFLEGLRSFHLLNAPSPGATAALAIAEEICKRLPTEKEKQVLP